MAKLTNDHIILIVSICLLLAVIILLIVGGFSWSISLSGITFILLGTNAIFGIRKRKKQSDIS